MMEPQGPTPQAMLRLTFAVVLPLVAALDVTCKSPPEEPPTPEPLPAIADVGPGSDVLAVRAPLDAVRRQLDRVLYTSDWVDARARNGELQIGNRPGLLLQLPTQQWTLFLVLGTGTAAELTEPLSLGLDTIAVYYSCGGHNCVSEGLKIWLSGRPVQSYASDPRRILVPPPVHPSAARTALDRFVAANDLHLPRATDADEGKIAELLARHPTARASAFRFFGTPGRILPPSAWSAEHRKKSR